MEKMREEFESWAVTADLDTSHYIDNGEMGDYCDVVAQYAWMGWKASRALLCIELPPIKNDSHKYNQALHDVSGVLQLSGVNYK
ncbi:MAG: hypothetical protein ACRCVV_14665 [Shewanella sp.]|uniref:hypothetical protein n=1 Tax=Aeromonas popoffii TaxID=70856 RepID=UPI003F39FE38